MNSKKYWQPMRLFLAFVLIVFVPLDSNAQVSELKTIISGSANVVKIEILGAHLMEPWSEDKLPIIFFEAAVTDSYFGSTHRGDKVALVGKLPLKTGYEYLVFIQEMNLSSRLQRDLKPYSAGHNVEYSNAFQFSQPYYFEIHKKVPGLPGSKTEIRAIYTDDRLQLPESIPIRVIRYQMCADPDDLLIESINEELCPTTKIVRYVEWETLVSYIIKTVESTHGGKQSKQALGTGH